MGIIRDSFVMFKNWTDAINALPEEYQLETYKAVVAYGINGEIPQNLSPIANAMLISFSKGMENSIARYNASVENGKKGGRPPKNYENPAEENKTQENLEKPNLTQDNQEQPSKNLNVNDNVNVGVNGNGNVNENKKNNLKESMKARDISAGAGVCVCDTTKKYKLESYEQIMDDFGVEHIGLREALFEFIRHCQLNGRKVTNEKLKQLIIRLDFAFPNSITNEHGREIDADVQKTKAIKKAINSGYFDIPDLRDGI